LRDSAGFAPASLHPRGYSVVTAELSPIGAASAETHPSPPCGRTSPPSGEETSRAYS